MIILIGASAAGKSTIEKELVKNGYNNIISYTSRPIRCNETNHKDYHFISKEEFSLKNKEGFFAENTIYNDWFYGIAKENIRPDAIIVVEPHGFRQLKKLSKENNVPLLSFFIEAPERVRLKRMVDRGDNLMEIFRRIFSDQGVFQGIEDEVDYIINNNRPIEETIKNILSLLGDTV